ncbi:MAG: 4Fe-4S binding protein [Planctomycetota bacterium]
MIREIVTIDEELCDGCGLCVPACQEGAIRIVAGKARLIADNLCDGLGACLGHCPQGAIKIEHRAADEFDEAAITRQVETPTPTHAPAACAGVTPPVASEPPPLECGCPGSRLMMFGGSDPASEAAPVGRGLPAVGGRSELTHWPVQLRLLPSHAPVLREASLLVAADCVPVAYPDFHAKLLHGRIVVIGCPKFDELSGYVDKLTEMIQTNALREIVVARMEVPCCTGITHAVLEARRRAGVDVQITELIIGTRGQLLAKRKLPHETVA